MTDRRHLIAASLILALVIAACGGAAPSTAGPSGPAAAPADAPRVLDPGVIGRIFDTAPGPDGEPQLVGPAANVTDVRAVGASRLEAAVDGRRVAIRVSWWSGVEPCAALAGVQVVEDGAEIALTVREGNGAAPDTMCTQQLVFKAAVVDLGELEPGTWTIRAFGDAPPIEVVVEG